jgi:uncharacterized protein (TIGR02001 family)
MINRMGLAMAAAVLAAGPALAGDTSSMFDVAFGAAVTSDYISDGITQTDHKPAVQGYVEATYGLFYAGVWASNVRFSGESDVEMDLTAGIRPEFGKFSFDFGYLHGLYANDVSDPWDELDASVEYAATDALTLKSKVAYNVTSGDVTPEIGAAYALPNNFEISSRLAYVDYDDSALTDYVTWDAGVSWTWRDTVKFDVRYYDTNLSSGECANDSGAAGNSCDARVVASVSVDTALSALRGGK